MAFAPLLLAVALGQACPPPPSPNGPPPCAVAPGVPGCLPGYEARYDRHGRLVYACAANAAPAPAPWGQPRAYEAPSPYAQPPMVAPPAPPMAPQAGYAPVSASPTRGQFAIVLMPGVASYPQYTQLRDTTVQAQVALEFRGVEGGGRVRLSGAWTSFGRIGELSVKYDFLEPLPFRPFVGVGLGVAAVNPDATIRGEGSLSGGVDLYLTRDFFLTAEVNGRMFTNGTSGPAHGLATSDARQVSFFAGLGFYM